MMARKTLLTLAAMMTLSLIAFAATKPNFGGTWTMDRGRSFGLPNDMNQTLTVVQKDDQLEVETKITQPNNDRTVKDTYVLDGKEYDLTPPAKGKRSAVWLPGDRGIQVTDVTITDSPKGPIQSQIVRKWTMSGSELVIDMYVDNPNVSYEAKRIFLKQ
jgi:hypothetical protein